MTLSAFVDQLDAFAAGRIGREELRRWLPPFHLTEAPALGENEEVPWSPARDEHDLFWSLVWIFEGDDTPEDRHRVLAGHVVRCPDALRDPARTLDLLPLIRLADSFCIVVEKHRRGIVSRTGLLSVISKSFRFEPALRDWLAAASPEQ